MDHRPEDITRHLASYWRSILACAGICAAAALGYSLAATVMYTATATVLVRPTQLFEVRQTDIANPPVEHERKINSLAALFRGEPTIREAVRTVGSDTIKSDTGGLRIFERFWELRRTLDPHGQSGVPREITAESNAVRAATKALHVSVEPKTNLISISFDHRDAHTASHFVNTLITVVRKKISEQAARDGAASFLAEQMKGYNQAYEKSLAKLAEFSRQRSVYGLDDQRKLKLQREGELLAAIQLTNGAILEKKSQAAELSRLLETFFPVTKYPQINELVKLSKDDPAPRNSSSLRTRADLEDTRSPLLLVKVYQETTQSLVKLRSDVAGLGALYNQQAKDIETVRKELGQFARDSATFELMQMEASQARQAAEQYKAFAIKEQVMAEASRFGLSPIFEIVQTALPPQEPSFPKPHVMILFGLVAGIALGLAAAVTRWKRLPIERPISSNGSKRRDTVRHIKRNDPAADAPAPFFASQG